MKENLQVIQKYIKKIRSAYATLRGFSIDRFPMS